MNGIITNSSDRDLMAAEMRDLTGEQTPDEQLARLVALGYSAEPYTARSIQQRWSGKWLISVSLPVSRVVAVSGLDEWLRISRDTKIDLMWRK